MKNILKYSLITSIMLGGVACTNLDEQLKASYTNKFDPNNPGVGIKNNVNKAQPNDGLGGAFSALLAGSATNGGWFAIQETGTDEAVITQKGGDWYDGGLYIKMHRHEFSPQTWSINSAWTDAYNGVYQCNTLLATSLTTPQKAMIRTLRAYFYWRLLDAFGNVKIFTQVGVDVAQSNRAALYDFVVSELVAAIPDLPAGRQDYGRISQAGGNALLARVYLNHKIYTGTETLATYQSAIDACDAVINSGIYDLETKDNYGKIFSPDNVDNIEHMLVVPYDESTGQGSYWSQMTLHYPSQLTYKLQQQPWNGFSTLEDFYNSYDAGDVRKTTNFVVGPQYDYFGAPILDLAFDKADPDGAPINYTPKINELYPNGSRQAGARFGKFSFKIGQSINADNDFPLLRYSEVLMNKAEALCRKNGYSDATALTLVNQIRTRAGASILGSLDAATLLAERGREFFVEALRRTDLIRFGAYQNAWWQKTAEGDNHTNLFAIPIEQMQVAATTSNPLTQNPGY